MSLKKRIKRLDDQKWQTGSRKMEADDESGEDEEQSCESNNGHRNTKNGDGTRLKEDEFEARLNAIELAKVEIERNITLESKNNNEGNKPKVAKEDVSKVTNFHSQSLIGSLVMNRDLSMKPLTRNGSMKLTVHKSRDCPQNR